MTKRTVHYVIYSVFLIIIYRFMFISSNLGVEPLKYIYVMLQLLRVSHCCPEIAWYGLQNMAAPVGRRLWRLPHDLLYRR